ncbi:MAG: TonB-dependent receptor, partial [Hymenobacter sp.]
TIKGKVTDGSDKLPLPGASVTISGGTSGVSTDGEGNYAINAPANATLIFTFVGYTVQQVPVNNRTTINVVLQSAAQSLEQVVVVGYGTQKRKDLTGSISSVNGDEIAKLPSTNPIAALQGKVPGLTISTPGNAGASPTVRIRGTSTTSGSADPIYVVDGIIQTNIDYLNSGDIETIDLLRDASSTAIYGLRGANGVIAVTTKKAVRGKTSVNFQTLTGVQRVTDKIAVTDAAGFKRLYSAQLTNLNAAPFDYSKYTGDTNWQNLILRNALINTNSLTISNGGDKSSTVLNVGYNKQDGVVKYNSYQKYIARLNEEIRLNDNIKVGGNLTGFHFIDNPTPVSLNNAIWSAPIVPVQEGNQYYAMPSFQRAQVGNPIANLDRFNNTSINKG